MSLSTSEATPSARVRMWRWGCTAASASVSSPWRTFSSARLWSAVICMNRPPECRYARESPTLASATRSRPSAPDTRAKAVRVVPMPRRSTSTLALLPHRWSSPRGNAAAGRPRRAADQRPTGAVADRDPGGHLPTDMTAHAVRHREEVVRLERQILIDAAHPSDIGGRARPQHCQRVTSKTVAPIWTRSPLPRRAAGPGARS